MHFFSSLRGPVLLGVPRKKDVIEALFSSHLWRAYLKIFLK